MPPRLLRAIDRGVVVFGALFCVLWAATLLVFPACKERPSGYLAVAAGALFGALFCVPRIRASVNGRLAGTPRARFLTGVILVALALRLIAVFVFPAEPVNDHLFYHRYAVNMLAGKGYGGLPWPHLEHLSKDGGLRAFYPPGWSLLLTAWYALTPATPLSGKVLNSLLGTGMVVLLFDIGRRAVSELAGRWAAVISAVVPTLVFYCASLGYEVLLGTLFCAVIDLALVAVGGHRRSWLAPVAIGLLLGYASLVKPIGLLVPVLLLVWWGVMGLGRRALLYAGAVAVLMAAVIAPWTWRNYRTFGRFVPISTNGGYALYAANHPGAEGIHVKVEPLPGEEDEIAMDLLRRQAAVRWIRDNPDSFLRLSVVKCTLTWGTTSTIVSFLSCDRMPAWQENCAMAMLNTAWAALAVVCLHTVFTTSLFRERRLYLALFLLGYLFTIHLVAEAESRHHIPVMGTLILLAGGGLAGAASRTAPRAARVRDEGRPAESRATTPVGCQS